MPIMLISPSLRNSPNELCEDFSIEKSTLSWKTGEAYFTCFKNNFDLRKKCFCICLYFFQYTLFRLNCYSSFLIIIQHVYKAFLEKSTVSKMQHIHRLKPENGKDIKSKLNSDRRKGMKHQKQREHRWYLKFGLYLLSQRTTVEGLNKTFCFPLRSGNRISSYGKLIFLCLN